MIEKTGSYWRQGGTLDNIGTPNWLMADDLQSLMKAFEDAGHEIYAVGGCVRDTVLGRDVHDIDLSTDALPADIITIVEGLSSEGRPWKAIPTGIEHGTITAVGSKVPTPYEITTFRMDLETDGRRATVAFSKSIKDDAARRDFTMNAFYADRAGRVRDVVGGSADLAAQRVRFIGEPSERIEEDFLRILRFFRFTASHGRPDEGVDPDGLSACASLAEGLEGISRERIGAEMSRIMIGQDPATIIGTMEQSGVLGRILPGANVLTLSRLIDLEGCIPEQDPSAVDLATRMAALGCEDISERLRLSKKETAKVDLVRMQSGLVTPMHELGFRFGFWPAVHCALLRWAIFLQPFDQGAIEQVKKGAHAEFPIRASDLMPDYEGKNLGDRLAQLQSAWIASEFKLSRQDLLGMA